MAHTLRQLLIQRAARLQERPALTAPGWGTLSYAQLRNRVEGIALGLLAEPRAPGAPVHAATGGPWDWGAEVAAACAGLAWEPGGDPVPPEVLGGPRFNDEQGRGPYHDREEAVGPGLPFHRGLAQGEVLARLARLNRRLGWDHTTSAALPLGALGTDAGRAALWSALYGGSHLELRPEAPEAKPGLLGRLMGRGAPPPAWDPAPFEGFWSEQA
jgi:hypothetical protein